MLVSDMAASVGRETRTNVCSAVNPTAVVKKKKSLDRIATVLKQVVTKLLQGCLGDNRDLEDCLRDNINLKGCPSVQ